MGVMMSTRRNTKHHGRRGSVLIMTLFYSVMFGALAVGLYAVSMGNMQLGIAEMQADRALSAAESGMAYLLVRMRMVSLPVIAEGSISDMATPSSLWVGTNVEGTSGNNGVAVSLASAFNQCGAYVVSGATAAVPTGLATLTVPAIGVDSANTDANFTLSVAWDSGNPYVVPNSRTSYLLLHLKSVGRSGQISRTVTMDVKLQKTLRYAVYSNVAIQLGKNVRVIGDVASAFNGTSKGPPVQMFSDFHYLPNMPQMETDLAALRTLLNQYDTTSANRLDVRNPNSAAAVAARTAGLADRNGDGFIDDYDVALKNLDTSYDATKPWQSSITAGEFTNPNTGLPYDADLWTLLDDPLGHLNGATGNLPNGTPKPWAGYDDGAVDNRDGYAKVNGQVVAEADVGAMLTD